jgi:hypothetical protein
MARKQSLVVVAPTLLVNLFGVPPMVRIPSKMREEITFEAHGKRWHCKRIASDTWMLSVPLHSPRARFGTASEIAEDIGSVLETGELPQSKHQVA